MSEANPAKDPINKTIVKALAQSIQGGDKEEEQLVDQVAQYLGEAQWLAATTHPILAPAVSMYASLLKDKPRGSLGAMKHMFRYIIGVKDYCLIKQPGCKRGLEVSCDADWAGMYALCGEKRSRTGIIALYDGMPIAWRSAYQQCKGTEWMCTDLISTSSAESEVYSAADAAKLAIHLYYVCEEVGIPVPAPVKINIDAGAALGFIQNTGTIGRMKHIDLRSDWVQTMRSTGRIEFVKIPGEDNLADFFTKIHTGNKVKEMLQVLMKQM